MLRKLVLHIALIILLWSESAAQDAYRYHSEYEKKILSEYVQSPTAISSLDLQLIVDKTINETLAIQIEKNYSELLAELQKKQLTTKSEASFLNWMFYKVHRKTLKNYQQYVTLAETLIDGNYDCLTATSLYAQLLTDLGYKPEVIETTYHIFLKIKSGGDEFLLESTDPINGFVMNEHEIVQRLIDYNTTYANADGNTDYYKFKKDINQSVELEKLTGLQYFNFAVLTFNEQNLIETVDLLEKAIIFYHSNRITEFGLVLANAISQDSSISQSLMTESLNRVANFINADNAVAVR